MIFQKGETALEDEVSVPRFYIQDGAVELFQVLAVVNVSV